MEPEQSRMARAALDWTLDLTAHNSGVSPNTIRRFERGGVTNQSTVSALQFAYQNAGISFLEDDGKGPGVRLKKQ
jgi:transcriptional regulator with XRE-family HTH domain